MVSHGYSRLIPILVAIAVGALVAITPTFSLALAGLLGLVLLTALFWRHITPAFGLSICVFVAVLGEQLTFAVGPDSGALPLGTLVIIYIAAVLAWRGKGPHLMNYLVSSGLPVVAWALAGAALIVAGLIVGFPVRTLAGIIPSLGALSALVIGATSGFNNTDVGLVIRKSLIPLLWFAAAVGLIQFLHHSGIPMPGSQDVVTYMESRAEELGRILIYGRAIGVYSNPNTFALLGGIALMFALSGHPSRAIERAAIAIPAIAIIGMSQSRATIIAVILSLLVHYARELFLSRSVKIPAPRGVITLGFSLVLAWAAVVQFAPTVHDALIIRVSRLLEALTAGGPADPGVAGRFNFWEAGIADFVDRPLGTLGPPQMVINSGIDNEYLFTLLQGGVVYLALLGWVMVAAVRTAVRVESSPMPLALPLYLLFVGVSQVVTQTIPAVLFWAILGAALAHHRNTATAGSMPLRESDMLPGPYTNSQGRKS